jgi:hypothetical protein
MIVKHEIFDSLGVRRNVCRFRSKRVQMAFGALALTFGAILFGGPPIVGYGLALHFFPSGNAPELILLGILLVWSGGLFLLPSRR